MQGRTADKNITRVKSKSHPCVCTYVCGYVSEYAYWCKAEVPTGMLRMKLSSHPCLCVCVYLYIYIYTYIHARTCACMHTHAQHWGEALQMCSSGPSMCARL
jgi:hypothetical protein